MKKKPMKENRKLVRLAIALSSVAILFFVVASTSIQAVSGNVFAGDGKMIRQAQTDAKSDNDYEKDQQDGPGLSLSDQDRSLDYIEKKPETWEELEFFPPERTEQTAPAGKGSASAEPATTNPTSVSPATQAPSATQTEAPTKARQTNVVAPSLTSAGATTSQPPVTKASKTDAVKTTVEPTTAPPTTAAPTEAPPPQEAGYFNRASCDEFISLLNQYRAENGKCTLKKSSQLTNIAESRAMEIVTDFSHAGIAKYGNYGENIFMGSGLPKYDLACTALQAFKNSSCHDTNQLYDKYNSVGVGHYVTPCGAHYWAVIFSF